MLSLRGPRKKKKAVIRFDLHKDDSPCVKGFTAVWKILTKEQGGTSLYLCEEIAGLSMTSFIADAKFVILTSLWTSPDGQSSENGIFTKETLTLGWDHEKGKSIYMFYQWRGDLIYRIFLKTFAVEFLFHLSFAIRQILN